MRMAVSLDPLAAPAAAPVATWSETITVLPVLPPFPCSDLWSPERVDPHGKSGATVEAAGGSPRCPFRRPLRRPALGLTRKEVGPPYPTAHRSGAP
jgi:hypothetical protein